MRGDWGGAMGGEGGLRLTLFENVYIYIYIYILGGVPPTRFARQPTVLIRIN